MRVVLSLALAAVVFGCGSTPPSPDALSVMSLNVEYQEPPPGTPRSVGGYAEVARLTASDGSLVFSGEIDPLSSVGQPPATPPTFQLAAGDYQLQVSVLVASDAISLDQNGNVHRNLGPQTSACSATVRIEPPTAARVVVMLIGGESCSITLAK